MPRSRSREDCPALYPRCDDQQNASGEEAEGLEEDPVEPGETRAVRFELQSICLKEKVHLENELH